ncbi:hypothetical protein RIB2604_01005720 [Aspergillus luchuensis]|uniref:Uncharacterized protein n=1 Tax=Aspergillus kawachii TaxID=1069201 RepID=A0A146F6C3_ASPKA|nr:hypothetical protein RIB2604_01005720 [Aspergillus luchuensis]
MAVIEARPVMSPVITLTVGSSSTNRPVARPSPFSIRTVGSMSPYLGEKSDSTCGKPTSSEVRWSPRLPASHMGTYDDFSVYSKSSLGDALRPPP